MGRHVGATDGATEFRVSEHAATSDELLEAYDDSVGPLELQVVEPGRIVEIELARHDT